MFWNGLVIGDAVNAPYDANTEYADWVQRTIGLGNTRADAGVVLGTGSEATQLDALQVTQNSPAGMSVLLNIGAAIVDGTTYINDSALVIAVTSNASGNPRIDTIVLRKTFATQQIRSVMLAGTPGATPVPPTLTQSVGVTWDIPIADIAVANGAVSITNANITSRTPYANAADGVYLDRMLNNTGAVNQTGDVLLLQATVGRQVAAPAVTTNIRNVGYIGAWVGRTANAASGRVLNRGIGYIRTATAVNAGAYGQISATSRAVTQTLERTLNTICQFLETTTGAGLALAFIDANPLDVQFGQATVTNRLLAPAAAMAITDIPIVHNTIIIEYSLRSAVAAATDTVNLRFGSAALDTTAADYYSYEGTIINSVAVVSALQNLGAVAGIQFTVTGSTAPANSYGYGVIQVNNVIQGALVKHLTGTHYVQATNANAGLTVKTLGGRWVNTAGALQQLSAVLVSGANFATDSYINVYMKQTYGS